MYNENKKKHIKPKLIGQGVYGCVYNPGYNCKNKLLDGKVTKLSVKNDAAINEINVGKHIKNKLENYDNFFIIQEEYCLPKKIIKDEKCDLINKKNKKKKEFIILMSKYVKSNELKTYLHLYDEPKKLHKLMCDILTRIDMLYKLDIIHMDMHSSNMLIDENKNLYVIDFGLALFQNNIYNNDEEINMEYIIDNILHPNDKWIMWSVEYNLIGHILSNKKFDNNLIRNCIINQYDNNIYLRYMFPNRNQYIKNTFMYFSSNLKGTTNDKLCFLFKHCKSWDYYSFAIRIMTIMIRNNVEMPVPIISLLRDMVKHKDRVYGPIVLDKLKLIKT